MAAAEGEGGGRAGLGAGRQEGGDGRGRQSIVAAGAAPVVEVLPEAAVDAAGGRRQGEIGGGLDGVGVRFAEHDVVAGGAGRYQVLRWRCDRIGAVHEL